MKTRPCVVPFVVTLGAQASGQGRGCSQAQVIEVVLQPDSRGIIAVTSVGFHEHVEGPVTESVQDALGFARDLLSPDMRVREQLSDERGYRWNLERRQEGEWALESTTGLMFWNYFGRRSERFYQNQHPPGRLGRTE